MLRGCLICLIFAVLITAKKFNKMADWEDLKIKVGVLKAKVNSIISYNPYDPIASTATIAELEDMIDRLNSAVQILEYPAE